jgi:biotin carboxyl carrier protein
MKYQATVNGQIFQIEIKSDTLVLVNGEERHVDLKQMGSAAIYSLLLDHQSFEAVVEKRGNDYQVLMFGALYDISVLDERALRIAAARQEQGGPSGETSLKAPMPGLIVKVPVEVGQEVKRGQTLVILESMKMENELKSPRDGVVQRVDVQAGQSVEQNALLVVVG